MSKKPATKKAPANKGKKTAKASVKKAGSKKAAAAPAPPAEPKLPTAGDQVNYVFTTEESQQFNKPEPFTMAVAVNHVSGNEVVIKCEPMPGHPWMKGCFYNADKKPGTWHWPK